jgi:hypothetical protein
MTIVFGPPPTRDKLDRWYATMTKAEVVAYAERKMMPLHIVMENWRAARKRMRNMKP